MIMRHRLLSRAAMGDLSCGSAQARGGAARGRLTPESETARAQFPPRLRAAAARELRRPAAVLGQERTGGGRGWRRRSSMADSRKDDLIAWLRDAHAMEAATNDNLERLIGRADGYPQLKSQLQRHLEVSRRQLDEVKRQLDALGADSSKVKDLAMRFTGWMEPLVGAFAADELPKHCLAAHAWENFEIASYRSMLGAAEELGMTDLKQMCERFIREEQEMAQFLYEHLPQITRQYLQGRGR
jgi:ferritin-like metal-binding protein YciE